MAQPKVGFPAEPDPDEELALIVAAQRGDREAFNRLMPPYGTLLFRIGLRILKTADGAQEVQQRATINAWIKLPTFNPARGRFIAWLTRIATNCALEELRRPEHW